VARCVDEVEQVRLPVRGVDVQQRHGLCFDGDAPSALDRKAIEVLLAPPLGDCTRHLQIESLGVRG